MGWWSKTCVMVVALIPIILIEVTVSRWIVSLRTRKLVGGVVAANLGSTFVGLPIAWILMVGLNLITTGSKTQGFDTPLATFKSVVLQAAWLVPYEDQLYWLVPAATLVLLIPYFLVSVYIERFVLVRVWKDESHKRVSKVSWSSNGVTYLGLLVVTVVWLLYATQSQP